MYIGEILRTSTLDWPGKVVMVIFLTGCNYRCPYCSNSKEQELTSGKYVELDEVTDEIEKAKPFIDAVVLSGGEPLVQSFAARSILEACRKLGVKTGIQTNGFYHERLRQFIDDGLLDGVFLDLKMPLDNTFVKVSGLHEGFETAKTAVSLSVCAEMRRNGKLEYYEVRSVIFPYLNATPEAVNAMAGEVDGVDAYVLVQGRPEYAGTPEVKAWAMLPYDDLVKLAKTIKKPLPLWVRSKDHGDVAISK